MKKISSVCIALVVVALRVAPSLAASNTVTYSDLHFIKSATFNWSNLNIVNPVESAPTNSITCVTTSKVIAGQIVRADLLSSSVTGSTFKITLTDSAGVDVLQGTGAVILTNAGYSWCPAQTITNALGRGYEPVNFLSALTFFVTNFASSTTTNTGSFQILYRE